MWKSMGMRGRVNHELFKGSISWHCELVRPHHNRVGEREREETVGEKEVKKGRWGERSRIREKEIVGER